MSSSITQQKTNVIWAGSAGRCAMCRALLLKDLANGKTEPVGEIAHIEGEKEGSKRYNPNHTKEERNSLDNLVLLCPNDHSLIDRDDVKYTVEYLKDLKKKHLDFISNAVRAEMPNVTFAELEVTISFLVSSKQSLNTDTSLEHITPREKIDKNKLSAENANLIAMGISRVKEVKSYLNSNPDISFAERLRTRLVEYYNEEKTKESDPNIIFDSMLCYMSGNASETKKRASALVVLTYFFETCDIFEK